MSAVLHVLWLISAVAWIATSIVKLLRRQDARAEIGLAMLALLLADSVK